MTSSCATSTENDTGNALTYFNSYFVFPLSPSILFSTPLSGVSNTFRLSHNNALTSNADGNAILLTCVLSAPLLLFPSLPLWASGIVSLRSTKQILVPLLLLKLLLTFWAWLRPGFVQKTQQPLLRSLTTFPSLTPPRQVRKGGGTGLLISNNLKYSTYTPLCNNHSLESHAIIVTAPVKLHVVVIYRTPGQLGTFLEELADLLSSFPEDVSSLLLASTCCPFKLLAIRCSWWASVRTQGSREKMAQIKRSVRPEYLSVSDEVHTDTQDSTSYTTRSTAHLTQAISSKHSTLSSVPLHHPSPLP